jgi:hypothetical protein
MATVHEVIEAYIGVWNATDDAARRRLLDSCWAADGTLTGPHYEVVGRAAMEAYCTGFQERNRGARVVATSGVDAHHDVVRYGWRIDRGDGSVLAEGEDTVIIGPDGRIARVLMFYGDLPPVAAEHSTA